MNIIQQVGVALGGEIDEDVLLETGIKVLRETFFFSRKIAKEILLTETENWEKTLEKLLRERGIYFEWTVNFFLVILALGLKKKGYKVRPPEEFIREKIFSSFYEFVPDHFPDDLVDFQKFCIYLSAKILDFLNSACSRGFPYIFFYLLHVAGIKHRLRFLETPARELKLSQYELFLLWAALAVKVLAEIISQKIVYRNEKSMIKKLVAVFPPEISNILLSILFAQKGYMESSLKVADKEETIRVSLLSALLKLSEVFNIGSYNVPPASALKEMWLQATMFGKEEFIPTLKHSVCNMLVPPRGIKVVVKSTDVIITIKIYDYFSVVIPRHDFTGEIYTGKKAFEEIMIRIMKELGVPTYYGRITNIRELNHLVQKALLVLGADECKRKNIWKKLNERALLRKVGKYRFRWGVEQIGAPPRIIEQESLYNYMKERGRKLCGTLIARFLQEDIEYQKWLREGKVIRVEHGKKLEKLMECGDSGKIVIAVSPSGYGKSTLAAWYARKNKERPVFHFSRGKEMFSGFPIVIDNGEQLIENMFKQLSKRINSHIIFLDSAIFDGLDDILEPAELQKAIEIIRRYVRKPILFLNSESVQGLGNEVELIRLPSREEEIIGYILTKGSTIGLEENKLREVELLSNGNFAFAKILLSYLSEHPTSLNLQDIVPGDLWSLYKWILYHSNVNIKNALRFLVFLGLIGEAQIRTVVFLFGDIYKKLGPFLSIRDNTVTLRHNSIFSFAISKLYSNRSLALSCILSYIMQKLDIDSYKKIPALMPDILSSFPDLFGFILWLLLKKEMVEHVVDIFFASQRCAKEAPYAFFPQIISLIYKKHKYQLLSKLFYIILNRISSPVPPELIKLLSILVKYGMFSKKEFVDILLRIPVQDLPRLLKEVIVPLGKEINKIVRSLNRAPLHVRAQGLVECVRLGWKKCDKVIELTEHLPIDQKAAILLRLVRICPSKEIKILESARSLDTSNRLMVYISMLKENPSLMDRIKDEIREIIEESKGADMNAHKFILNVLAKTGMSDKELSKELSRLGMYDKGLPKITTIRLSSPKIKLPSKELEFVESSEDEISRILRYLFFHPMETTSVLSPVQEKTIVLGKIARINPRHFRFIIERATDLPLKEKIKVFAELLSNCSGKICTDMASIIKIHVLSLLNEIVFLDPSWRGRILCALLTKFPATVDMILSRVDVMPESVFPYLLSCITKYNLLPLERIIELMSTLSLNEKAKIIPAILGIIIPGDLTESIVKKLREEVLSLLSNIEKMDMELIRHIGKALILFIPDHHIFFRAIEQLEDAYKMEIYLGIVEYYPEYIEKVIEYARKMDMPYSAIVIGKCLERYPSLRERYKFFISEILRNMIYFPDVHTLASYIKISGSYKDVLFFFRRLSPGQKSIILGDLIGNVEGMTGEIVKFAKELQEVSRDITAKALSTILSHKPEKIPELMETLDELGPFYQAIVFRDIANTCEKTPKKVRYLYVLAENIISRFKDKPVSFPVMANITRGFMSLLDAGPFPGNVKNIMRLFYDSIPGLEYKGMLAFLLGPLYVMRYLSIDIPSPPMMLEMVLLLLEEAWHMGISDDAINGVLQEMVDYLV